MIHLMFLMRHKPGLSREACQKHWREIHAPLAQRIPGIRRYVQSHALNVNDEEPPYDGMAEIWVDDEAAAVSVFRSKEYLEGAYLDEPNFVDIKRVVRLRTEDHILRAGQPMTKDARTIKRISLVKRKSGMSKEEFFRYWKEVHGPIALQLPGLLRYVQSHALPSMYANDEPPLDGVAQVWFSDRAAMERAFTSKEYLEEARPDGAKFIAPDGVLGLVVEENRVVWP